MQGLEAALETTEFFDESIQELGIVSRLLRRHLVFDQTHAVQHLGGFPKGLKQFLAHTPQGINIKFLLQIGDARITFTYHLAAAGLLKSGDDPHLGGFAGAIYAHKSDAVPGLHLPAHIFEHLSSGVDLADTFEAQHGERDP